MSTDTQLGSRAKHKLSVLLVLPRMLHDHLVVIRDGNKSTYATMFRGVYGVYAAIRQLSAANSPDLRLHSAIELNTEEEGTKSNLKISEMYPAWISYTPITLLCTPWCWLQVYGFLTRQSKYVYNGCDDTPNSPKSGATLLIFWVPGNVDRRWPLTIRWRLCVTFLF